MPILFSGRKDFSEKKRTQKGKDKIIARAVVDGGMVAATISDSHRVGCSHYMRPAAAGVRNRGLPTARASSQAAKKP